MRLRDRANCYVLRIRNYLIIKKAWEKEVAIFYQGRCIQTVKSKSEALAYVKKKET